MGDGIASSLKVPRIRFLSWHRNALFLVINSFTDTLSANRWILYIFIGPGYFSEVLEKAVGRKALTFSKPGKSLAQHILSRFQIADPSRYLFIGDKLTQDVAFGSQCGFQKLLVFTGGCTKEQLFSDQLPVEQVPDYYADSLADFIKFFDDIEFKSWYL